jgi:RNA polymerase sigma-70 factor, ECF subfamily
MVDANSVRWHRDVDFEIGIRPQSHPESVIGHNDLASSAAAKIRELRPRPKPVAMEPAGASVRQRHGVQRNSGRVEDAVRSYLTLVWQVLRRSGLRPSDADDATQDVFWVFAQRSDDVPEAATRAFLVGTALRVASDRRKSKWNCAVTEPIDQEVLTAVGCPPDEQVQLRRQTRLLDDLLTKMAPDESEIFILFEIEEMTRTEVAAALGIPEGTAASRLRRARDSFERLLQRSESRREQSNV